MRVSKAWAFHRSAWVPSVITARPAQPLAEEANRTWMTAGRVEDSEEDGDRESSPHPHAVESCYMCNA